MFNISKSQTLIAATVMLGVTSVFSSTAFAGTTGSVLVQGVVTSTLTMSTTAVAGATSLGGSQK